MGLSSLDLGTIYLLGAREMYTTFPTVFGLLDFICNTKFLSYSYLFFNTYLLTSCWASLFLFPR
jgi:hypothetical protein